MADQPDPLRLILYPTSGFMPEIRPAPATRPWMDATPEAFAYRCLPLNIANAQGWELLCPLAFHASWTGRPEPEAVNIHADGPAHLWPTGHFGQGVLTFHVHALFRTEPEGIDLWVGGPVNRPKDGIQPLTGIVETDWSPYTFTMNWVFTRPGVVRFEKGEPFCQIWPQSRTMLDAVQPEVRDLATAPELAETLTAWQDARNTFNADLKDPASEARDQKWQKAYYRGLLPGTDQPVPGHRTKQRLPAFCPVTGATAGTSPQKPPSTEPEGEGDR